MKKLLALCMAFILTFQLVTPVFAEEIEETQTATEAVEVETEAPVTEAPTTEPPVPETAAPEETSAPTEPQPTTEVTEATETTVSTEETTTEATEPTEETTEPALDLLSEDGNVIASGTCGAQGDNLTWVLAGDGTLTISGSGEMKDYSTSSVAPWYTKRTKILSVVVEDGVTGVGDYAFYACLKLASVTLPEGINSIGCASFQDCAKLAEVNIPNSVTRIGIQTFQGCSKLTSVTIPEGVTSIDYGVFYDCSSLTSVTIPEGVTSIGDRAFQGCSKLTSVTIPEGVTSIDYGVFFDCSSLTSVSIPEGVTSIGNSAFYGCSSLTSVTIPEGVTSIDSSAFQGCSSLTSVTIPESVASIGRDAFQGCSSLMSVTIPEGVTSIDSFAFSGCSSLTSVSIPEGVTSIGDSAFSGCSSLTSVSIPGGVTSIDYGVFSGCSGLTSVSIPEGVTSIGIYAFQGCSSLTSVTIPEGVTSIGDCAFAGCSGLTSITIPESVTRIGNQTFEGCSKLTSVTIPEGVTSIDYGVFFDCSSLTSVSIPEGVTSIGTYAFYGCSGLTSVTIPEGVTSIGDSAFYGCSSLTSVTIPEGVTSIDYGVFSGCSSLTSVTIPEGVTSIGIYAFHGCSGLTSVTIPEGVTSIGDWAFNGCDAITDVYYSGTEEEWQAIEIGNYNDALSDATIHYNYVHIHNLEHIPGKTATCTEAGNLEYWHCLVCDTYFTDEDCTQGTDAAGVVLPALGHTMALTEAKAATCTEDGSNAYYTCSSCHTVFKDAQGEQETTIQAEIVPALGHDMAKVEAVAPTYVAAGNNEYYTCSRCGKAFKDELGEIETTVEEETLPKLDKGIEIRPVDTSTLSSGRKLTLTAWAMPDNKKAKVKWSLSEDSKAYASISSSGVLTAKTVSEVQNITVIATPTDGSPEARKEIRILPKITVKQTEKYNLFYGNGRAKLAITGGQVASARFAEPSDFVLDNNDGQFYIRLAEGASVKPKTKVTLEITLPGCDIPVRQSLTIATTNAAPKLKLNPTASIVNTTLTNSLTVETAILGTEDTLTARSATKGVTASVDKGILTLTLDNGKTTTATVYLKGSDWAKEIRLTHRITVTGKKPTVKLSAKGKLDVLNPASEIIYTPKLTNATGTITDVRLEGQDANLFNAEVVDGLVHLKLAKSGENYSTRKTYKVTPVVTLLGKDITAPTLSIKVTQSALKLARIPNQTVSKSSPEDLTVNIKITSPLTAEIGDMQMNAKTTDALRKANFVIDGGTGNFTFPAAAFTDLKPGKYTVILDVPPANAASDTKPTQARFTLTVQK